MQKIASRNFKFVPRVKDVARKKTKAIKHIRKTQKRQRLENNTYIYDIYGGFDLIT